MARLMDRLTPELRMAASNLDDGAVSRLPSAAARLREARWPLVITASVLAILYAAALVSAAGAVILFAVLAGAVALAPRPTAAERRAARSEPTLPVWPETGIESVKPSRRVTKRSSSRTFRWSPPKSWRNEA